VKHTATIVSLTSLNTSIRVCMVMMQLRTTLYHSSSKSSSGLDDTGSARRHVTRWWHTGRSTWTSHVWSVAGSLHCLARADLCHAANASGPQPGVLVAVPPAVNRALDQTALATKARVELGQRPAHGVALGLVDQAVSAVLVLAAARSWVDAILRLEVGTEGVNVDRLDIASDGVLHLYAIARVLECDPLHPIAVLSYDEWGCCRDGAGRGIWVNPATRDIVRGHGRAILLWVLLLLRGAQWTSWGPLELRNVLHLGSRAVAHARLLLVLLLTRVHGVLTGGVRHEKSVWLRSHALLLLLLVLLWVLPVWGGAALGRHWGVLLLLWSRVVERLLLQMWRGLAVHAAVLIVTRW
jgi:hypothetical protein